MKIRLSLILAIAFVLPLGSLATVNATEPELNFFDTAKFPEILQNDVYKMKCTITWDPTSKMTEITSRCTRANQEVYAHGNATPLSGDPSRYTAGAISYLSFTVKSVDAYSSFPMFAQMCAGAVHGVNMDAIVSTKAWIEKNYKGLSNKKKISKKINGHDVSIIGGAGAIRVLTCGSKPKK